MLRLHDSWQLSVGIRAGANVDGPPGWGASLDLAGVKLVVMRAEWTCTVPDCEIHIGFHPRNSMDPHPTKEGPNPLEVSLADPVDGTWDFGITFPSKTGSAGALVNGTVEIWTW